MSYRLLYRPVVWSTFSTGSLSSGESSLCPADQKPRNANSPCTHMLSVKRINSKHLLYALGVPYRQVFKDVFVPLAWLKPPQGSKQLTFTVFLIFFILFCVHEHSACVFCMHEVVDGCEPTTRLVLGMKPRSSARGASALHGCTSSPAPLFFKRE